jgi:hypothetical protein
MIKHSHNHIEESFMEKENIISKNYIIITEYLIETDKNPKYNIHIMINDNLEYSEYNMKAYSPVDFTIIGKYELKDNVSNSTIDMLSSIINKHISNYRNPKNEYFYTKEAIAPVINIIKYNSKIFKTISMIDTDYFLEKKELSFTSNLIYTIKEAN